VKDNGIKGTDVKNGSLTADDFAGSLPAGERGPAGPKGPQGPKGATGAQGEPGVSVFDDEIPSGETVYGTLGERMPLASGKTYRVAVSFPVPAPEILEDADVSFAPGSDGEDDAACTGSSAAPTAPPGKVCLYTAGQSGNGDLTGDGSGNPFGFVYTISSNGGNPDFVGVRGSWAYTAP
jgi:hypothetical protein